MLLKYYGTCLTIYLSYTLIYLVILLYLYILIGYFLYKNWLSETYFASILLIFLVIFIATFFSTQIWSLQSIFSISNYCQSYILELKNIRDFTQARPSKYYIKTIDISYITWHCYFAKQPSCFTQFCYFTWNPSYFV